MADLLTHALIGYALATALSWRHDWIGPSYVTLAMVGALVPDLSRMRLFVPAETVEAALGVPFSWGAFHTLGGTLAAILLLAALIPSGHRRRAFYLLAIGAASHHALDLFLIQSSGYTYDFLWPLTDWRAPSADVYISSDREPAVVAVTASATVWFVRYHLPTLPGVPVPEERSG